MHCQGAKLTRVCLVQDRSNAWLHNKYNVYCCIPLISLDETKFWMTFMGWRILILCIIGSPTAFGESGEVTLNLQQILFFRKSMVTTLVGSIVFCWRHLFWNWMFSFQNVNIFFLLSYPYLFFLKKDTW